MKLTKQEIGAILKQLREENGFTQKEVAEHFGRRQQIIGHWETGYSQPDAGTLFELCDFYGADIGKAFGFYRREKELNSTDEKSVLNDNDLAIAYAYHYASEDDRAVVDAALRKYITTGSVTGDGVRMA